MYKVVKTLAVLLAVGLLALANPKPAHADGGVGIVLCIGGNHGVCVRPVVGNYSEPGWGSGFGGGTPYGLNGSPNWGGAGYGLVPTRPYPQPIPEEVTVDMKMPTYGWIKDPVTGQLSYGQTGYHIEKIKVHKYLYP